MNQSDILELANKLFPNNYGVLLTGSQRNYTELKKEGDIDVLILDAICCHNYSTIITKDDFQIEFIIVPAADIDNILDNDLYEPKNGLLSLAQGSPLSDPYGIVGPLLKKVSRYFNTIQFRTYREHDRYIRELMKLRKLFIRPMPPEERQVVLCDFVSIVTLLETIRVSNWSSKTKHKIKYLAERSPDFLPMINTLFQKGLQGDYEDIRVFINYYERSYGTSHLPAEQKYDTLTIDLEYPGFSLSHFVNNVLPLIMEVEELRKRYRFFYLSPRKYKHKYRHKVSLEFSIENETETLQILRIVQDRFQELAELKINYDYLCAGKSNNPVAAELTRLKAALSGVIGNLIRRDNDFNPAAALQLFRMVFFYLRRNFSLSNADWAKCNAFLVQKWIFTLEEQIGAPNYPALCHLGNHKIKQSETEYKKLLPALMQEILIDEKQDILLPVIDIINTMNNRVHDLEIPEDDINACFFKGAGYNDPKATWLYKNILEEILLVLDLPDFEKYKVVYCCSKAIVESGIEIHETANLI